LTVKENRMKKLSTSILTGAAFALLLVGCQQDDPDPRTSDAGSPIIDGDARISPAPARDPSLPAAADAPGTGTNMEGQKSGNQDSSAIRDQTSPDTLTREEERNDMPLPGQNGDHSTPNPDKSSSR
jgi:hypothetical protein